MLDTSKAYEFGDCFAHIVHKNLNSCFNVFFSPSFFFLTGDSCLFVADVLVSTPNRLVFMLQQDPPLLDLSKVEWLVVDEADKLFEDGVDGFRNQVRVLYLAEIFVLL
jgi:hypothetical protein